MRFVAMITCTGRKMVTSLGTPLPPGRTRPQPQAGTTPFYLDVLGGLKAVKLVEELQHRALDLAVPTRAPLQAGGADGVDLIHEDDGGRVFPGHHKQLPHHAGACGEQGGLSPGTTHSSAVPQHVCLSRGRLGRREPSLGLRHKQLPPPTPFYLRR